MIKALMQYRQRRKLDDCALDRIKDLEYKVQFLLDNYIKCEENKFCFPDGEIWEVNNRKGENM